MHLDEEQVQRLLHRELGSQEATVRAHLEACTECRYRVTEAEREESWLFDRLHLVDHAAPKVKPPIVPRSRRAAVLRQRLAAGILFALVTGGVAYAAPGSPLPRVVSRIIESMRGVSKGRTTIPAPPPQGAASEAGIVVGAGDRLVIVFPAIQTGSEATVSLTEAPDVVVRALNGAAFTSDFERLRIDSVRPGSRFEVQIPRSAPSVEIRAGRKRLFLKQFSRVVTDARPDANGNYRLPLSDSAP